MTYQPQLFPDDDAFRSSDNCGLEPLPEGKALPFVKWAGGKRSIIPIINGFLPDNRHYNELVLNFVNLCYTDLLSYDRRLTHDQFSRSQG